MDLENPKELHINLTNLRDCHNQLKAHLIDITGHDLKLRNMPGGTFSNERPKIVCFFFTKTEVQQWEEHKVRQQLNSTLLFSIIPQVLITISSFSYCSVDCRFFAWLHVSKFKVNNSTKYRVSK